MYCGEKRGHESVPMMHGVCQPGLMGMAIFFTSTAVGPAILPWEARSKTLERLISSPVEVWALLLGGVFASFVFGLLISLIPLAIAVLMGVEVVHLLVFCLGMILATICFASLSILLSVYPPTDVLATVMMLSSLVRFPLVFISGVFVPVEEMPAWGQTIASASREVPTSASVIGRAGRTRESAV